MVDWIVVLVGGIIGWGLVSLVSHLIRQQKQQPVEMYGGVSTPSIPTAPDARAEAKIDSSWHEILNVPEQASAREIEDAYHLKIADCDRIRFSTTESPEARRNAETRRAQVNDAYGYIRPLRAV